MPRRYPRQCRQAERFDGDFLRRRRVSEHVHAFHVGRRRSPHRNSFFRRRWGVLEVPCPNRFDCSSETFRNAHASHVGRRRSPHRNSFFRRSDRCRVATPGNAGKQRGSMGVSYVGVACRSTCPPRRSPQIPPSQLLFPTKQLMPRRYPRQCRQAERFDGGVLRRRRVSGLLRPLVQGGCFRCSLPQIGAFSRFLAVIG